MSDFQARREQYSRKQQQHWKELQQLFETYKETCGVSISEFAHGLDVSRQFVYNFMDDPSNHGFSKVSRYDLIALWDYITDPKEFASKKLKEQHREARNKLRQETSAALLKTAGFFPEEDFPQRRKAESALVQRAQSRLSSSWIQDESLREYIVNNILDQVLDQGRSGHAYYVDEFNYNDESQKRDILNFPRDEKLYIDNESIRLSSESILERYRGQIRKLAKSGKTAYVKSELFELYQSILEHRLLNEDATGAAIILDCQFETISPEQFISRIPKKKNNIKLFDQKKIYDYELAAESALSFTQEKDENTNLAQLEMNPRLIKAKVTCTFANKEEDKNELIAYFENISTATHIENMLTAVQKGLGYELKLAGFFVRATGRTAKSLARVSISLEEKDASSIYQGWWVGSNTITGILRATGDAFARYLSKAGVDEYAYYKTCYEISKLTNRFHHESFYLYEGRSSLSLKRSFKDLEITDLADDIYKVRDSITSDPESIDNYSRHLSALDYLDRMLQVLRIHAFFIRGDLSNVSSLMNKYPKLFDIAQLDVQLNTYQVSDESSKAYLSISLIHQMSCVIRFFFMSGRRDFLLRRHWKIQNSYSLNSHLSTIRDYVIKIGNIDFDSYFCASQIIGIVSQLDLYSVHSTRSDLKSSVENLIKAAHYSYRIGHFRRASQWILNAVRTCCRLGQPEDISKAHSLCKIADSIREHGMNFSKAKDEAFETYVPDEKGLTADWLLVNQQLASGEVHLAEKNYDEALLNFCGALNNAYRVGYLRIEPDCLYNISRTSKEIAEVLKKGKELPIKTLPHKDLSSLFQSDNNSVSSLFDAAKFESKNSPGNVDWESLYQSCQQEAAEIWDRWSQSLNNDKTVHPFSESIRNGTFWTTPVTK